MGYTGTITMISPHSALPTLTDSGTTIDGRTQTTNQGDTNPNGPEVVINGSSAGAANGFLIHAGSCVIQGLNIGGFNLSGILIEPPGEKNQTKP